MDEILSNIRSWKYSEDTYVVGNLLLSSLLMDLYCRHLSRLNAKKCTLLLISFHPDIKLCPWISNTQKNWWYPRFFSLKQTPEYSRPNIKHWKMLECDDPAPTVFDKTAYIKYHFSCTVKSSTKNTQATKSTCTSQSRKTMFEVPDFDCQKIVLFVVLVMLPIYSAKWSVECAL